MAACPRCGTPAPEGALHCASCGFPLPAAASIVGPPQPYPSTPGQRNMKTIGLVLIVIIVVVVFVLAVVLLRGVVIVNKTCTANRSFGSVVTAQWTIELRNDGMSARSAVVQYLLDGNVQSTQTYTLAPGQVQTFAETFGSFSYPGSGQPSCDSRLA